MRRATSRRLFRTVLFTDIVGSTELAAQLGDRRWRRTVANHHALIRRELRRHHGREVDTAGDGFFAVFENPTDAVRCAASALAGVHGLGLRIRAAVHTGEVEPAGDKFGGIAVHIGARLLAMAAMEEVLVSGTVRDLVSGSGHEFEDRGTHELRGVPGEWHVHALVLPQLDESIAVGAAEDDDDRRAAGARRQRLVLGGLVGVIALLILVLAGVALLASRAQPPPAGPDTAVAYDPGASGAVRGWQIGAGPESISLADGVLWVASSGSGTVSRIDLGSGQLASVGQAGTRPSAVVAAAGRTWVADRYANRLAVLDARQGNLVEQLAVHGSALAHRSDGLWVADDLSERLILIDAGTNAELASLELPVPSGPTDLAVAGGVLWVAAPRASAVLRVDPDTREVSRIDLELSDARSLSGHGDDLWVASAGDDTVVRFDAAGGRVALRTEVCDNPVAIAGSAQGAWVVCTLDSDLWRLDRTGNVVSRIDLPAVPADVTVEGERAWVALRSD